MVMRRKYGASARHSAIFLAIRPSLNGPVGFAMLLLLLLKR